jgi:hypothetical protein
MALTTFQGPVRSLNGFISQGPGSVRTVSTATATLDVNNFSGRIINITAASTTITLPIINASADPASSGPGSDPNNPNNLGMTFTFFFGTTATAVKILCGGTGTPGDLFFGTVDLATAGGASNLFTPNNTSNDAMNFNGGTSGGVTGSYVTVTAVAANRWLVVGQVIGIGSLVTPFGDS